MLEIAAIVDIGKSRGKNDDRLLINSLVWEDGKMRVFLEGEVNMLAVADGVGGGPAGGIAAEIVLKTISEMLPTDKMPTSEEISEAIQLANTNVYEYGAQNPSACGLATTLSGVAIKGNAVITFNVGDSRVYRYRQGILYLLTMDHSVIWQLIEVGQLTEVEAKSHESRSTITRCIGIGDACIPDIAANVSFYDGDIILICSDGLSDCVERDFIAYVLAEHDLSTAADELVKKANDAGGYDNISVVLAKKYRRCQIYERCYKGDDKNCPNTTDARNRSS